MLPNLGPLELMFIMGIAVLLFGKRLPEVGRSLGRGIVEFKKGLNGVGDEFDSSSSSSRHSSSYGSSYRSEEPSSGGSAYSDASVPKFELPGTASSSGSASASGPASSPAPTPQMEYHPPPHD
jgi:sec-independent protein translocase protein TatA